MAQLAGNSVKMDVGGDLNIVTLQDKSTSASEQHSSGLRLEPVHPTLCYGNMVSGSISKSDASFDHNYQSATGQSGIVAGSWRLTMTVKGNTGPRRRRHHQQRAQRSQHLGPPPASPAATCKTTRAPTAKAQQPEPGLQRGSALHAGRQRQDQCLERPGQPDRWVPGMPTNGSSSGTTQSGDWQWHGHRITGTGDSEQRRRQHRSSRHLTSRDPAKASGALTNTLTLQQAQQVQADRQKAEDAQADQPRWVRPWTS